MSAPLEAVNAATSAAPNAAQSQSRVGAWTAVIVGSLYFLIPLAATFEFSLRMRRGVYSFDAYKVVLGDPNFQASFGYSILMALLTIVVGILLVVPTAYWVQLRLPKLRPLVEFITLLPLVIPAIVIVFGYLRIYNSSSILPLTGNERATDFLLVCGYVVLSLPYMYRSVDAGLRAVDIRSLTEAAECLGASWPTILFKVIFPNIRSGILSGAFLTFAVVIGEFTLASLLDRPAFGPYLQLIGANRAYEPSALAIIAFVVTWASMGLIQVFGSARGAARSQTR
ncbi:ABC transporter permease [Paraburkholderia sp.]|uniref:ABC transporter permease n=1 Tax=Paraburkholderia sp. TaxID=1926495 RepID=UPI0023862617|nr:ABC transporter permease [Paraburkholderia sp.]MDE1178909.1 ABC transporter permease [Paraburkholderia sp.]